MSARAEDPDLYLVLEVDPSATPRQITHAYQALMRRHHPDTRARSPHAPRGTDPDSDRDHDTALQQIAAAYAVLGDAELRAHYDTRRAHHAKRDPQQRRASPNVPLHTGPAVILGEGVPRPK